METLEAGRTRREHGCRLQMRSCRVKKSSNFNVTVACNCLVGFMYIYTCISLSEDKCNCMECCQNIQKLNNKEVCLRILTWQELFQNILQFHRSRFWVYRQWSIFQFLSLRLIPQRYFVFKIIQLRLTGRSAFCLIWRVTAIFAFLPFIYYKNCTCQIYLGFAQ